MLTLDSLLGMIGKQAAKSGEKPPPRAELEPRWNEEKEALFVSVRAVVKLMQDALLNKHGCNGRAGSLLPAAW
jgi:hypothetical protein